MWVALAAITMSFAALTSALVVRQGSGIDWQPITLPPILFGNTIVLLLSSATLEVARRRIGDARGLSSKASACMRWMSMTLGLGLLFVGGQYTAWLRLRAEGLYLATNANSSFFYVFTGVHALHVLGGLAGLLYVVSKLRRSVLGRSTFTAAARYWHFMGALWVYLLFVLWSKLQ
jgi:cytochrome c oxidase subunit 3